MNLRKDHYRFSLASPLDEIDNFSGLRHRLRGVQVLGGATCVLLQSHGSGPADCVSAGACPWPDLVISPLEGLSAIRLLAYLLSTRTFQSENQIQHYTVDHLAQGSMKNGANSEMPCELQDT